MVHDSKEDERPLPTYPWGVCWYYVRNLAAEGGGTMEGPITPSETPPGYTDNKAPIIARLRRIEGQVRGLQRQVDSGTCCVDILTQVSATTRALQSVALLLLEDHLEHCMSPPATAEERRRKVVEASEAIARLVRS